MKPSDVIGEGSFGSVMLRKNKLKNEDVALKKIEKNSLEGYKGQSRKVALLEELKIW